MRTIRNVVLVCAVALSTPALADLECFPVEARSRTWTAAPEASDVFDLVPAPIYLPPERGCELLPKKNPRPTEVCVEVDASQPPGAGQGPLHLCYEMTCERGEQDVPLSVSGPLGEGELRIKTKKAVRRRLCVEVAQPPCARVTASLDFEDLAPGREVGGVVVRIDYPVSASIPGFSDQQSVLDRVNNLTGIENGLFGVSDQDHDEAHLFLNVGLVTFGSIGEGPFAAVLFDCDTRSIPAIEEFSCGLDAADQLGNDVEGTCVLSLEPAVPPLGGE